jgi:hypothetical protein
MSDEKDYKEEIEVKGSELVDRVKQLIEEGNVRRLIIRKSDGEVLMEVPLTASVLAGGALLVFTPLLAALGAAAAFLAQAKIEIVRVGDKSKNDEENAKTKVDIE